MESETVLVRCGDRRLDGRHALTSDECAPGAIRLRPPSCDGHRGDGVAGRVGKKALGSAELLRASPPGQIRVPGVAAWPWPGLRMTRTHWHDGVPCASTVPPALIMPVSTSSGCVAS